MNDPVEEKLKAEIDDIMKNVDNIIKKIENLDPDHNKASKQKED